VSWPAAAVATTTQTTRYGAAVACACDRLHPAHPPLRLSTALDSNTLNVVAGLLLPAAVIGLPPPADPEGRQRWTAAPGGRDRSHEGERWRKSVAVDHDLV